MFINYSVNSGISINPFRYPNGYANSDIAGLVDDIIEGRNGCCPLEGAREILEDGHFWQGSNATQEILEKIHAAITEHEDSIE